MELTLTRSPGVSRLVEMTQEREDSSEELVDRFLPTAIGGGACHTPFTLDENDQHDPAVGR